MMAPYWEQNASFYPRRYQCWTRSMVWDWATSPWTGTPIHYPPESFSDCGLLPKCAKDSSEWPTYSMNPPQVCTPQKSICCPNCLSGSLQKETRYCSWSTICRWSPKQTGSLMLARKRVSEVGGLSIPAPSTVWQTSTNRLPPDSSMLLRCSSKPPQVVRLPDNSSSKA